VTTMTIAIAAKTAVATMTIRMPACLRPHISSPVAWAPLGSR
jgi:hypothetical protein